MKVRVSPAELHLAVNRGLADELRRLLEVNGDPNSIYRSQTALGTAVSAQDFKMTIILLSAGADPSIPSQGLNGRLEPPLYTACRLKNEDLVQALIQAGADVNGCDFYGHTPLWVATKGQRPMLVAKLLASGSRLGSNEDYPWSQCPLYLATKYLGYRGRHQLALFLMAAGADPTLLDTKGRSALYWCLRNRDHDLFSFMIDAFNPRCWPAMLHQRMEGLLNDLPEDHVKLLEAQLYNPPSLAKQCRLLIRGKLLKKSNHLSLFNLVPQLRLPPILEKFLLFNQDLPQDELVPCFMKN